MNRIDFVILVALTVTTALILAEATSPPPETPPPGPETPAAPTNTSTVDTTAPFQTEGEPVLVDTTHV